MGGGALLYWHLRAEFRQSAAQLRQPVFLITMTDQDRSSSMPRVLPVDWWTTADVLDYLRSVGAPISRSTWSTYVSRGQAPVAEGRVGAYPVWRPDTIRKWQAGRPGHGGRKPIQR